MQSITKFFKVSGSTCKMNTEQQGHEGTDCEMASTSDTSVSVNNESDIKENKQQETNQSNHDYPIIWSLEQKNEFCKRNDWLCFKDGSLGCSICKKVGTILAKKPGMQLAKEWINISVMSNGDTRKQQLTSLRKKIFKHKDSQCHKCATTILLDAKKETFEKITLKNLSQEKDVTAKVFRTAYKVAKENQSFNNFESEIDLQELNGLDMGRILHSTNACINIVGYIGQEMRKKVIYEIINSDSKIALLIDESTTLSKLSCLIVYVRVCLPNKGMTAPVNLFLDLIELQSMGAKEIFNSLMTCLKFYNMTEQYLKDHLVALACDGAAVMLGRNGGVSALLKQKFPSLIVWHCTNHRLELSVHDTVKKVAGINRFKAFMDKLYAMYHASPKNSRELRICAESLEIQILKIGRILGTRWVASSYRTVSAVWENYEALVKHFTEAKCDPTRDKSDQCMYKGLLKKITSVEFVLDLALLCDGLQELSELSLELQARDISLNNAHQKLKMLIQVFEARQNTPGPYYEKALKAADNCSFFGIQLHKKNNKNDLPIDPRAFYSSLKESMEKRLLNTSDYEIVKAAKVLYMENWPVNVESCITFGENDIKKLSIKFHLNERDMIRAFREYLLDKNIPEKLSPLFHAVDTIPVSTSECERGFSQMNLIVTPTRSSLLVTTVSSLLVIRLLGPPLVLFNPNIYVDSWLLKKRHSAIDTNSKGRRRNLKNEDENMNMAKIWKFLE